MSLLTQFYNCSGGGGGSTFPDGVPAMAMGGTTSNAVTQAYSTDPIGAAGFNMGGGTLQTHTIQTQGNRTLVLTRSDPGLSGKAVAPAPYTGVPSFNGSINTATGISGTAVGRAGYFLVFENVYAYMIWDADFGNHSAIYGLRMGGSPASAVYYTDGPTWSGGASAWYHGYFRGAPGSSGPTPMTWNFPNLTDVTTCEFYLRGGVDMSGCILSQASVDHVMATQLTVVNSGDVINLGGGCSPPSAAGLITKAALIAAGATVITN